MNKAQFIAYLAPQFGDEVVKVFQTAPGGGVVDALTAKAFFENAKQSKEMLATGQKAPEGKTDFEDDVPCRKSRGTAINING